eukprot:scaffold61517_cov67-Cyclotella_meneghiniana.AAC.1
MGFTFNLCNGFDHFCTGWEDFLEDMYYPTQWASQEVVPIFVDGFATFADVMASVVEQLVEE